jgi:hypothetical protein
VGQAGRGLRMVGGVTATTIHRDVGHGYPSSGATDGSSAHP